jgi:hypothetical protein
MVSLARVASTARSQHGLITFEQLVQVGITLGQLRRLVRIGALIGVRRGVYRLSGAPTSWAQCVLAAVLAAGSGAVASHTTAGVLWDLSPIRHSQDVIHITAPRQVRLDGVCAHFRTLGTREQRTRNGIRVTSVERTIFDLAGIVDVTTLGKCVDDGLRRDLMRLDRLRDLVDRQKGAGRRPLLAIRQVLADRIEGYDAGGSDWERDMDRLWDNLGLPPATRQYRVTVNGRRYILDRALPELKIGIEWNGFTTHGTRSAFDYDSDRRADLTAAGWHVLDFTSRSDPRRLVAAVRGAIQTRMH